MDDLFLGIDLGTSGIRCAVVDSGHDVIAMTRADYPDNSAEGWWKAVAEGLSALHKALGGRMTSIKAAAVDGTSGSMVLVDAQLSPVGDPLMYNSGGFENEARAIAMVAPAGHITQGPNSALARLLRLQHQDNDQRAMHMCHQADFILARLRGAAGVSDENNCLKTGYDPETRTWPSWLGATGLRTDLLPEVHPVGTPVGTIDTKKAVEFGLSPSLQLKTGTTDSIAAFLASGLTNIGEAVTSLGTTLAIKMISPVRIDDPKSGLYSHRLGNVWLVGGASNSGGGALLQHFSVTEMDRLSALIDPSHSLNLGYYPLAGKGERFPVNDPALASIVVPRPADDHLFLQGLLEGIADIEARCYKLIADHGAPYPSRILTAGGGAQNPVWTAIRKRVVSENIDTAEQTEAAVGMALLSAAALPGASDH